MNCEQCRNYLLDYLDKELIKKEYHQVTMHLNQCTTCQEELDELSNTVNDFRSESKLVEVSDNIISRVETQIPKEKQLVKQTLSLKHTLGISSLAVISSFIIALFTSPGFYYWFVDITPMSYDHVERAIAEGYGEELHLVEEDNDIRISFTKVIADELATHLYYEIEDLSKEQLYTFQNIYHINVTNGEDVWPDSLSGNQQQYVSQSHDYLPSDEEYIQKGRIEFMPIEDSQAELELMFDSLIELPDDNELNEVDPSQGYSFEQTAGNWSFKIPVAKSPIKEYDLFDQTEEIEGNDFTFRKLSVGPTKTVLAFRQNMIKTSDSMHYHGLAPTALYIDDKRFDYPNPNSRYGYLHAQFQDSFERIAFESVYFENLNDLSFQFDFASRSANKRTEIDLDVDQSYPYEVDYLDLSFTIEELSIEDESMTVIIEDKYYPERTHESIHFSTLIEYRNIETSHHQETVIMDEHGNEHEFIHEYHMNMIDNPRFFTTKYEMLLEANDGEKIEDSQLIIDGYNETIPLDYQIAIERIEEISHERDD
ncbi:DUF4179 domain-containing protein [Salipaludibacillus daqingensis]|uniref:DUF4179 domain-containing protein n=1 Tax=Salipaludibacillus daqingensis TaxID=3041001 RepID=UPI002474D0F8|nr:DUF4179 domain-containing protein [Salipaludibacillus daqingensis]